MVGWLFEKMEKGGCRIQTTARDIERLD